MPSKATTISQPAKSAVPETKLHKPRAKTDWIKRPRLSKQLDAGLSQPLILLSAPAGFGKSTILAEWLEHVRLPAAWISLDEHDNDLFDFLAYLTGALQTIFPDAMTRTAQLHHAIQAVPFSYLAASLINDIAELPNDFILVLDDYHAIVNPTIHELVTELVEYAPRNTHLVLAARADPPLPLPKLRARREMTELRAADLRFTQDETRLFLATVMNDTIAAETVTALETHSEGWGAALQLAALSLRQTPNSTELIAALETDSMPHVMDFLMTEVLVRQDPVIQEFLLRTSILDRLHGELCDFVIGESNLHSHGQITLSRLERMNLFLVPLDTRGEWYRYHHLFRELLRRELSVRNTADEIANLHRQASRWFAGRGLIDKAIAHALAAGDIVYAGELVEQNIHAALNREDWRTVERWLSALPEELTRTRPALVLARAWTMHFQNKLAATYPLIVRAEALLAETDIEPEQAHALRGEIDSLRAQLLYFTNEYAQGLRTAQRAHNTLPAAAIFARSHALLYLAIFYHALGDGPFAIALLQEYGESESAASDAAMQVRTLLGLAVIHGKDNETERGVHIARQMLQFAETRNLTVAEGWGHYILGATAYERNEPDQARLHFEAVSAKRYLQNTLTVRESLIGLALVQQASGQSAEARKTMQDVYEFAMATNDAAHIRSAQALSAHMALVRGDVASANTLFPLLDGPPESLFAIDPPCVVQIRILLALGDKSSLDTALTRLEELEQFCAASHNNFLLFPLLTLHALVYEKLGRNREALKTLQQAVALGQPRRAVRPFLDLGAPMARLLRELHERGIAKRYIGSLLAEFSSAGPQPAAKMDAESGLYDALTTRELQVLALIEQRYSDREIAQTLVISPFTVRTHVNNIYTKLDIHDRRGVAAKARALGLLQ